MLLFRWLLLMLAAPAVIAFPPFTFAQDKGAAAGPEFEVATIKPISPGGMHIVGVKIYPGGKMAMTTLPLKALIVAAFDVSFWQLKGGEDWMGSERWDIEAQPPESMRSQIKSLRYTNSHIDDPVLRQMVQSLLINRFHLKWHRETKTDDIYFLTKNGKPLKLGPAKPIGRQVDVSNDPGPFGSIGYVDARWGIFNTSMAQLARFASDYMVQRPVLDRTELSGFFDYRQQVEDFEPAYGGSGHNDSFMNMLSDVGLKLEKAKGQVETFVIDSAARPTAN